MTQCLSLKWRIPFQVIIEKSKNTNPCFGFSAETVGDMKVWQPQNPNLGSRMISAPLCSILLWAMVRTVRLKGGLCSPKWNGSDSSLCYIEKAEQKLFIQCTLINQEEYHYSCYLEVYRSPMDRFSANLSKVKYIWTLVR